MFGFFIAISDIRLTFRVGLIITITQIFLFSVVGKMNIGSQWGLGC